MASLIAPCHVQIRSEGLDRDKVEQFFDMELFRNSGITKTENCLIIYFPEGNNRMIESLKIFPEVTVSECVHKFTKCSFPLDLAKEIFRVANIFRISQSLGISSVGLLFKAEKEKVSNDTSTTDMFHVSEQDKLKTISEIVIRAFPRNNSTESELSCAKSIFEKYTSIAEVQDDELSKRVLEVLRRHLKTYNIEV